MKFIIFSDLHINDFKEFDKGGSRLDNCLKCLEQVYEIAKHNDVRCVLFCGDLFDQQKELKIEVINKTVETFLKLKNRYNIRTLAISGNHDQDRKNFTDKRSQTALTFLEAILGGWFRVIDRSFQMITDPESQESVLVAGVEYMSTGEDFQEVLKRVNRQTTPWKDKVNHRILLIHQTPKGISNPYLQTDVNPKDKRFFHWDIIFSGHIHQYENITDKMIMVGNTLARDFGDADQDKGVILYDTNEGTVEFIPTDFPRFRYVEELDENSTDYERLKPGSQVHEIEASEHNFDTTGDVQELLLEYTKASGMTDDQTVKIGIKFAKNARDES